MDSVLSKSTRQADFRAGSEALRKAQSDFDAWIAERAARNRWIDRGYRGYKFAGDVQGKVETGLKWVNRLKRLADEDTRFDEGVDLAVETAIDLLQKRLPWVLDHPYLVMHRAHLEVFVSTLKSMNDDSMIRDAWERVTSAIAELDRRGEEFERRFDPAAALTQGLQHDLNALLLAQWLLRGYEGLQPHELRPVLGKLAADVLPVFMRAWNWAQALDSAGYELLGFVAMSLSEKQHVALLYQRYRKLVKKAGERSALGRIVEYAAEQTEAFDTLDNRGRTIEQRADTAAKKTEQAAARWAAWADRTQGQLQLFDTLQAVIARAGAA